jgi:N-acetylneuraminate synthase
MVMSIRVGKHSIGPGLPCMVIAEAGVNHNGNLEMALRLVDAAAEAGADVVKFQTFKSEEVISPVAPKAAYQVQTTGAAESQLEMVRKLELPPAAFATIDRHCRERGLLFLSTPFDRDIAAFKIPSGEVTNLPFLTYVAKQRKPVIMSTGMSTLDEVAAAVKVVLAAGTGELALLHCVSNYPALASSVNLRAMKTLEQRFGVPVGYSDHTEGIEISLAAAALGACIVEKHFTLDRTLPGPDHRASLEPRELAALVRGVRSIESALGDGRKVPAAEELNTAAVARRSLVAVRDLAAGTILTEENIVIRRPGTGLPPSTLPTVLGRRLRQDVAAGALLSLEMLA